MCNHLLLRTLILQWLPKMKLRAVLMGYVLLTACRASIAGSYSLPLEFEVRSAPSGTYLAAPFDFEQKFERIESVRLELVLPGGYQGTAMTTGNSFYLRDLNFLIHDPATPIDSYLNADPAMTLHSSLFNIPDGAAEVQFRGRTFPLNFDSEPWLMEPSYPDYLLAGRGELDIVDRSSTTSGLLSPGGGTTTTSWMPPGQILSARLTIETGTVPEARSLFLVTIAAALLISQRSPRN